MKQSKSKTEKLTDYGTGHSLHPKLVEYYFSQFGAVEKVLDLGCGIGDLGRWKPEASIEVYGLDIDQRAVKQAKEYEKAQVYDLESGNLPFDDEYFDAVLAKDILEHLRKPWELLSEIYRVLKVDKIVYASVPMARPKVVWGDYTHVRGFTRAALTTMFKNQGFEICTVEKWGGIPLGGKLGIVKKVPILLRFPIFDYFFASSWGIKGRKPDE